MGFRAPRLKPDAMPGRILHVAQSLYHDIEPAKRLGLRTVWVDRRGGKPGGATPKASGDVVPDLRVTSLGELVELEQAGRRAWRQSAVTCHKRVVS